MDVALTTSLGWSFQVFIYQKKKFKLYASNSISAKIWDDFSKPKRVVSSIWSCSHKLACVSNFCGVIYGYVCKSPSCRLKSSGYSKDGRIRQTSFVRKTLAVAIYQPGYSSLDVFDIVDIFQDRSYKCHL